MLAVSLVVSITGIKIMDRIAKIFKNDRPVAKLNSYFRYFKRIFTYF